MTTPQGPKQPLEEMQAEIEQLWTRIARLETVASAARTYLTNSTPVNALVLDKALKQAKGKGEKQG
jgi:hypothetical protein